MQEREDAGLEFLLRQARSEGQIDSSGFFTLDAAKAREKLARFQLPSPEFYILSLLAAAVAGGADCVEVHRKEQLSLRWNGTPPSAEELPNLWSFALSSRASTHLRELGLGLHGAASHRGEVTVEAWDGHAGMRFRLSADGEELQPLVECPWSEGVAGCRVLVGAGPRPGLGWRRPADFGPEAAALEDRCKFAAASLRLDGRELTRPVELGRCLVKKRIVGAGPRIVTSASASLALEGSWHLPATAEIVLGGEGPWTGILFLVSGLWFAGQADLGLATARAVVAAPLLVRDLSGERLVENEVYSELVERLRSEALEMVQVLMEGNALPPRALAPLVSELAERLEQQQEFGEAHTLYHWLVARLPEDLHPFGGLLRTAVRLEQHSLVEALYARLQDKGLESELAQAGAQIGQVALQRGDRELSARWFRRAAECLLGSDNHTILDSAEMLAPALLELGCEGEAETLLQRAIMGWLEMSGDTLDHERLKPQVPETLPIWLQTLFKGRPGDFHRSDYGRLRVLCEWLARVLHSQERRVPALIEVLGKLARWDGLPERLTLELEADLCRLEAESGFRALLLELYRTEWEERPLLSPRPRELRAPESRKRAAAAYRSLLDRKILEKPAQACGIAARLATLESLSADCVGRIRLLRAAGRALPWLIDWDWKAESEGHRSAGEFLTRTVERLEKALGSQHPSLAASLNALGELQVELGRAASAERCFLRALETWEAVGDSQRLVALANLAIPSQGQQHADRLGRLLDGLQDLTGLDPAEVAPAARRVADRDAGLVRRPWTVPRRLPDRLRRLGDGASLAAARTLSRYSIVLRYQILGPARIEGSTLEFELERYAILQRRLP